MLTSVSQERNLVCVPDTVENWRLVWVSFFFSVVLLICQKDSISLISSYTCFN
jgi:hypothetical protein